VEVLPVLQDNYTYLLVDPRQGRCVVLDPAEAGPVLDAVRDRDLEVVALAATHPHRDHVAGIPELVRRLGPLPVYGAAGDRGRIPGQTHGLAQGQELLLAGARCQVLELPGHTRHHLGFYFPEEGLLFCGDVLFGGGCGRLFEGTAADMQGSLERLAGLPDHTRIYCGHEYTASNLRFALTVEPDNPALQERAAALRPPTVPLVLAQEKATNVFLRWAQPAVQAFAGARDPVEVFAALRGAKDRFR
jgi:hydroxyacylglutathione hydrolase